MPPKEKVIEAWTALADGRVRIDGNEAVVKSSDDSKQYKVRFDGDLYASDDNATYWRGYPGYPVIAVLMLQHRLPYNEEEAALWKDVNWKAVNTKYKNNYRAAVEEIARERGIDLEQTEQAVDAVMKVIENLPLQIKRKI